MDRDRDRSVAEDLIEDARKTTGDSEAKEQPGTEASQPSEGEEAQAPKD